MLKLFKKLFSRKSSWKDGWKETAHSFDLFKGTEYDTIICFKNNNKHYGHLVNHESVEQGKEFILALAGILKKGYVEFTGEFTPDSWTYRSNPALLKEDVDRFEKDFIDVYYNGVDFEKIR